MDGLFVPVLRVFAALLYALFLALYGGLGDSRGMEELSSPLQQLIERHRNHSLPTLHSTLPLVALLNKAISGEGYSGEIVVLERLHYREVDSEPFYQVSKESIMPEIWSVDEPPFGGWASTAGEAHATSLELQNYVTPAHEPRTSLWVLDFLRRHSGHVSAIDFLHPVMRMRYHGVFFDTLVGPASSLITWNSGYRESRHWDMIVARRFQSAQSFAEYIMHPLVRDAYRHEIAACRDITFTAVSARPIGHAVRAITLVFLVLLVVLVERLLGSNGPRTRAGAKMNKLPDVAEVDTSQLRQSPRGATKTRGRVNTL